MQYNEFTPIIILNSDTQSDSVIRALKELHKCAIIISNKRIKNECVLNIDEAELQTDFKSKIVQEYEFVSYFCNVSKPDYKTNFDNSLKSSEDMYKCYLYNRFLEMLRCVCKKESRDLFDVCSWLEMDIQIEFYPNDVKDIIDTYKTKDVDSDESDGEAQNVSENIDAAEKPVIAEPEETKNLTLSQKYIYTLSCIKDAWKKTKYRFESYNTKGALDHDYGDELEALLEFPDKFICREYSLTSGGNFCAVAKPLLKARGDIYGINVADFIKYTNDRFKGLLYDEGKDMNISGGKRHILFNIDALKKAEFNYPNDSSEVTD